MACKTKAQMWGSSPLRNSRHLSIAPPSVGTSASGKRELGNSRIYMAVRHEIDTQNRENQAPYRKRDSPRSCIGTNSPSAVARSHAESCPSQVRQSHGLLSPEVF